MGTYPSTYIGIYMQVPHAKKNVVEHKYFHPITDKEMRTPFDPVSGEKAIVRPVSRVEEKTASWALNNADESYGFKENEFWSPEWTQHKNTHTTLLINSYESEFRSDCDEDNNKCFTFSLRSGLNLDGLIEEFKTQYKKEIDYLEANFGPVIIDYGIVHYYH